MVEVEEAGDKQVVVGAEPSRLKTKVGDKVIVVEGAHFVAFEVELPPQPMCQVLPLVERTVREMEVEVQMHPLLLQRQRMKGSKHELGYESDVHSCLSCGTYRDTLRASNSVDGFATLTGTDTGSRCRRRSKISIFVEVSYHQPCQFGYSSGLRTHMPVQLLIPVMYINTSMPSLIYCSLAFDRNRNQLTVMPLTITARRDRHLTI